MGFENKTPVDQEMLKLSLKIKISIPILLIIIILFFVNIIFFEIVIYLGSKRVSFFKKYFH